MTTAFVNMARGRFNDVSTMPDEATKPVGWTRDEGTLRYFFLSKMTQDRKFILLIDVGEMGVTELCRRVERKILAARDRGLV